MTSSADLSERQLAAFELAVVDGEAEKARLALRDLLFTVADKPVSGSAAEAISAVAKSAGGRAIEAALVLRALGENILIESEGSQIARNTVTLAEIGLPEFCSFLGLNPKAQNFEKFEILRGAHDRILAKLEPLRTPYADLKTLISAKARVVAALNHGQVRAYLRPYHVNEVAEMVERLFSCLARTQKPGENFGSDIETCRKTIAEGREFVARWPSFLTIGHLTSILDNAEQNLAAFLSAMHGRLAAEIQRTDQSRLELQKRYPLHEEGRDLRVVVPFQNTGPGTADNVSFRISSRSNCIAVGNEQLELGSIAPGQFSISFDALVTSPCDAFEAEIEVTWGEIGGDKRREEIFEIRALAQRSDIDWADHKYWNPYSTEPAQGSGFYGRVDQVETLVARLLQEPMEPSYITGQKRVGKTSLAKTAVDEAKAHDPRAKLTGGYVLWGRVAHEDPRQALRQLGEAIERMILSGLPESDQLPKGDYDGTLAPLLDLLDLAQAMDPERRFVAILDEFDEMPEDLYLKGNLAETFFANIRALTTISNFCLLLVGGENMPFVMERQGQKLNKFNRVNLTYFSRVSEWDDFVRLVRGPSEGVLTWHADAVSAVFNLTNGNPYFSKIICKEVAARAVAERDGEITAEEVENAVRNRIAALDTNAFMHLWEDGTRSPLEEREIVILKRRRTLAALARCIRAGRPATLPNIQAHRGGYAIEESELAPTLRNFIDRGVLLEAGHGYDVALPIFRLWLVEVGLNRIANDGLSEELASLQQQIEDEAYVRSVEIVELTKRWGSYRGVQIGPETVRTWLEQRPNFREQRLLFSLLDAVKVVGQDEIYTRLRQAGSVIRNKLGVYARKSEADRRSDVILTYVDGEGKSGQRYASDYAEENKIHVSGILPPSSFKESFEGFETKHGTPRALVIVDDVVGTGGTLSEKILEFLKEHIDLLETAQLHVEVYSLFSTPIGKERVLETLSKSTYSDINFSAGEILEESLFAFGEPTGVFGNAEDFDRAKSLATDIGVTIYKNHPFGIGGQALLLVLPNTVPNNSLPLLHSASKDSNRPWSPLFPRIANG